MMRYSLLNAQGVEVSSAEVSERNFFLSFFPRGGLHIGPCFTVPSERGKGLYPLLLTKIMKENPMRDFYMIVSKTNRASIRGIEKAGLTLYAEGKKTRLHRYKITRLFE